MTLVDRVVRFGRLLRRSGVDAHPGKLADAADALGWIDIGSRDEFYHALRTVLVDRHEHLPAFDRAFAAFWREQPPAAKPVPLHAVAAAPPQPQTESGHGAALLDADGTLPGEQDVGMWSDVAGLADKDFAEFTTDEIRVARVALSRLVWSPGVRRTRRWVRGRGERLDLRRAIAWSRRTGGEVIRLPRRGRRVRPRPLVLIADISGSMERYSRMLLHFAHTVSGRQRRFEAFVFSTELTRITRELRTHRIDAAVGAVSRTVTDWSGGTRIGAALRRFHQRWGRTALTGGAVVLLVSDGWDRGDPDLLRDEVARLQRSCHRLIWLNPLIGTADYAPLTRGLRAALPFVDDFLPARTLTNLADLAAHLNALAARPTR